MAKAAIGNAVVFIVNVGLNNNITNYLRTLFYLFHRSPLYDVSLKYIDPVTFIIRLMQSII